MDIISDDMLNAVKIPSACDKVFKDECPFSFQTAEVDGVYICMKNFLSVGYKYLDAYAERCSSQVFLRYHIKKLFKPRVPGEVKQTTKVAIGVPGGFELPQERYTVNEQWCLVLRKPNLVCVDLPSPREGQSLTDTSHLDSHGLPKKLAAAITAVQCAESALLAEERAIGVEAWEQENMRAISAHAFELKQLDNGVRVAPSGWKCTSCELRDNLWMNLTDGSIHCGRRFWDGTGGNNHAVEYFKKTGYPLVVKLGTITPEGAEVYSYAEDDMVVDPLLAEHLAHFGIDVMTMCKTDKTMAELEISANEKLEWLTLQEADHTLESRYGPGMTGLRNLGNSCYINAVIQVLFAIPQFRWFYAYRAPYWIDQALTSFISPGSDRQSPVDHVGLQMAKLGHALCSGAHSWLAPPNFNDLSDGPVPLLPGIRPLLFRRMIGHQKPRFANKDQQDSFDFFIDLLDILDSQNSNSLNSVTTTAHGHCVNLQQPSSCFRFQVENRLECGLTHKVRYSTHEEVCLSLPVPVEAMSNRAEFYAYEQRRLAAEAAGTPLKMDDVVRPRIPFEACLSAWIETERIEGFRTPASQPPGACTHALQSSRMKNFPDYLCVQMSKYTVGSDWLPRKLDVEIELPYSPISPSSAISSSSQSLANWQIDLTALRSPGGGGLQSGEQLMPDDVESTVGKAAPRSASEAPNPEVIAQLTSMGFSAVACRKACLRTGNGGIDAATNWLMEHMDDPDLNVDSDAVGETNRSVTGSDDEAVQMLVSMGLTRSQALAALMHANNNLEMAADFALTNPDQLELLATQFQDQSPAECGESRSQDCRTDTTPQISDGSSVYELCAFVSHMGKSTNHGHYIAHIKRSSLAKGIPDEPAVTHVGSPPCGGDDQEWIIFNDDRVARSETPPAQFAYLYFFRRMDSPRD